jgi:hydrogenase/urease accessory protein HupE
MSKDYTPIPELGSGWGSLQVGMRSRLYTGADHLLLVQSTGYTEDYRRVFFRDIRYVVAEGSHRHFWISFALAAIIGALCLLHLAHLPWMPILIVIVPFVVGLTINLIRGPACNCYINTGVQTLRIPTPARLNKMPVFVDFLKTKTPAPLGETAAA